MRVLIAYDVKLECCGNKYYHNFLNDILKRYSIFGELSIIVTLEDVEQPSCEEVDMGAIKKIIPLTKINTLKKLVLHSATNKHIIEEAVAACDFVIAHVPSGAANTAVRIAHKQHKPTFVTVIGCPWDALWNYDWRGKLLAPSSYLSCRKTVAMADFVQYVTSDFLQKRYPSRRMQLGCSDVCIYSIDEKASNDIQERWKNTTSGQIKNIVTCASVGVAYKGQSYIIRAIARLNRQGLQYHYHLYGGGNPQRLKDLVHKLGVEQYVHFHGLVAHEKIMECIKGMDIYAQPSLQEGLPRSVIEAMSVGLPVMTSSDVGGMNELTLPNMRFRKKCVDDIVKILQYDKDKWISASMYSIARSEEYEYSNLQKRRDAFYQDVLKSVLAYYAQCGKTWN